MRMTNLQDAAYARANRQPDDEWRGIATAPRDGTRFWARISQVSKPRLVRFLDTHDRFPLDETSQAWSRAPTQWKPDLAGQLADMERRAVAAETAVEAAEKHAEVLADALTGLACQQNWNGHEWAGPFLTGRKIAEIAVTAHTERKASLAAEATEGAA